MISRHCLIEAELVEQRTLVVVLTPHHRPSPTQNIVRRRNQCSPKPSNHFCNKIGPKRTNRRGLKSAVVRCWPNKRQNPMQSVCPLSADFVAKVGDAKSAAIASMY